MNIKKTLSVFTAIILAVLVGIASFDFMPGAISNEYQNTLTVNSGRCYYSSSRNKTYDKLDEEKSIIEATDTFTTAETDPPTQPATQPSTEKETEQATEETTDKPTEAPTEEITDPAQEETPEQAAARQALYQEQWDMGYIMAIDNPDYGYWTSKITLTEEDRYYAERIVMGEAGSTGFIGCALVAQTLKDAYVFHGYRSIKDIQKGNRYDGWYETPNADAINAVRFIFDENRSAVAHRLLYFYGTYIKSEWHESMNFVCQYGDAKFFD